MASDWAGASRFPVRPLFDLEGLVHNPWIAYGFETDDAFTFLTFDMVQKHHLPALTVDDYAFRNVAQRPFDWLLQRVPLDGGLTLELAVFTGDYCGPERLTDPQVIDAAARTLGARDVALGLPRRGVLMATDADQDTALLHGFLGAVGAQYLRAESPPITPLVVTMKDGAISDIADASELGQRVIDFVDGHLP